MGSTRPPPAKVAGAALALSAPAAAVLLILSANHVVAPGPALLVWLVALAGAGLFVRRHLRAQLLLFGHLERLADGDLELIAAAEPLPSAVRRVKNRLDDLARRVGDLEASLPALLDALPDPVLTIDAQRRVVQANQAAREVAGREPVGFDLAESLRAPAVLDAVDAVLDGAPTRAVEFRLAAPVERHFSARVARLARSADGAVAALALKDFTEMRRIEQMRADFVANASHEIRTPLATLAGCVETLQGPARDDPEARERFLAMMQQQAERMTRLVSDLLSLSRIELNEHVPPRGTVRLPDLLGRVIDGLGPKAASAGVAVELAAAPGLPPAVGDADELWQVFQNLIDNAIKYGADGKRVEVRCERAERSLPAAGAAALKVSVRDFGPGIPREHLPRLTERFYRVDTARSRQLGGTGLGLAIAKHIVNRHRGALTVESTLGQGSTFTVYLPAAEGPS